MAINIKRLEKQEILVFKDLFEKTKNISVYSPFNGHSIEEFEWSFFSDYCEKALYIVSIDDNNNQIIGTQAGMIIPMKAPDGKVCKTIKAEDTVVNIDGMISYKKRDILKEMFDKIDEKTENSDIHFLWGYTDATKSFKRIGFSCDFKSQHGLFVFRPIKAYNHLKNLNKSNDIKQKLQILALSILSFLKAFSTFLNNNVECKEITLNQVDEDKLLSFLPRNLYSIYLDKKFLKWRIEKNPSKLTYSILQFKIDEKIVSYLIYSKKGESIFFVEQFLFDHNISFTQKQQIIKSALSFLKGKNAAIIRVMGFEHNLTNKEEVKLLKSTGFIFLHKGIGFIFKSKKEDIESKNVYLSRLNTQGIY